MDIICARCREPWDAHHLRHDMHRWRCTGCHRSVQPDGSGGLALQNRPAPWETPPSCPHPHAVLEIDPAADGQVPDQVQAWTEHGQPGWLRYVTAGLGCPDCHGTDPGPVEPLSDAERDDIDTATEGAAFDDWL